MKSLYSASYRGGQLPALEHNTLPAKSPWKRHPSGTRLFSTTDSTPSLGNDGCSADFGLGKIQSRRRKSENKAPDASCWYVASLVDELDNAGFALHGRAYFDVILSDLPQPLGCLPPVYSSPTSNGILIPLLRSLQRQQPWGREGLFRATSCSLVLRFRT